MERKIGETFEYKGRVYKTIQSLSDSCINCVFVNGPCYAYDFNKIVGGCSMTVREDKKNIIFKEIKKDIEIKDNQLTINIPDGMEIDILNSNFGTGVICFKKKQPEFKDGDILYAEKDESHTDAIFIFKTDKGKIGHYACLILRPYMVCKYSCGGIGNKTLRYATEEEKRQLFEALAKEGKVWDAESKAIVDLKPKCEFKPFDRCIWKIRNCEGSIWKASFVSYVDEYGATPMGMSIDEDLVNLIILPYNEETAKLIGTTDDWKGG